MVVNIFIFTGMDGYQALPEDHDTEEIANQLMSNLNIPSEDSALVPLIVDGDINTDDKILSTFVGILLTFVVVYFILQMGRTNI